MGNPGNPDWNQDPARHPGGQNYPVQPTGGESTRPIEQSADGGTGYTLGYAPGAYGPQCGSGGPPQHWMGGPPPPGGNNTKKALWIAGAATVVVALVAGGAIALVNRDSSQTTASSAPTSAPATTRPPTTTAAPTGIFPSGISVPPIPPIFGGGATTGPNAHDWVVEVTGSGSAELSALGIPDVAAFATQPLPWTRSFRSDAGVVAITVLGYTGAASCKITRDGAVVDQRTSEADGGLLFCTAF